MTCMAGTYGLKMTMSLVSKAESGAPGLHTRGTGFLPQDQN